MQRFCSTAEESSFSRYCCITISFVSEEPELALPGFAWIEKGSWWQCESESGSEWRITPAVPRRAYLGSPEGCPPTGSDHLLEDSSIVVWRAFGIRITAYGIYYWCSGMASLILRTADAKLMWALSWHVWIMQTPWINENSVQGKDRGMITISPSQAGALCLLPVSRRSQFVLSPPDLSIFDLGNHR